MILVTGASGFVGTALCARLCRDGAALRRVLRQAAGDDQVTVGSLAADTDWRAALTGVHQVVHLAARVHVMDDPSADPLAEFRRVNVEASVNLARQAAAAGVRRFVYLSSAKVNGESTLPGRPFSATDVAAPADPYGISKWEAEQALGQVAASTGMELVVIRPPLIYGPGVKANFATMMRWVERGLPLPLGAVSGNRRSLLALDNLVDLIVVCLHHPAAAAGTFLVSDGEDLSTADLLCRLGLALGKPARLVRVPLGLLRMAATLVGSGGVYRRLCSSLQLDIGDTRRRLGWTPPLSVDEGLRLAAKGYDR
ncbi:UDP-glucose 4-epimerase family protein [Oryzomicrobium sp.]|uniref:UDP-glucose 4-epimerase family protein n=1 Tax=Oryzomicrobium sp. TaxID=1911578 RepID=UPI002FE19590